MNMNDMSNMDMHDIDMNDLKLVLIEIQRSELTYGEEKEKYFVNTYEKVSNKYPMIIKRACESGFDYAKIFWMIEQQDKVRSKVITQHDASVEVGEVLVNEHIKPALG